MQVRECKGAGLAELNGGTGMHLFEPTLSPIVCCSFGFVFVGVFGFVCATKELMDFLS